MRALDGRFVPPTPGGDLIRQPEVLPTGRNLYAFDPYRIPSAAAMAEGSRLVDALLARATEEAGPDGPAALPETVAMVLWGTDNMKRDGAPVAQALALLGARPRFDSYGRLSGAELVSLEELGRPRIDVVMTTSGVFRDLLPLQLRLLAQAARMAALADEPLEMNHVRAHALAQAEALGCSVEDAEPTARPAPTPSSSSTPWRTWASPSRTWIRWSSASPTWTSTSTRWAASLAWPGAGRDAP